MKFTVNRFHQDLDSPILIKEKTMITRSFAEMIGKGETLSGQAYNNEYCWIMQVSDSKIIKARVYYDDVLVNSVLT